MNPKAISGTTHQILSILKFLPPLVSYGLGRQQSCNKRNPQCYWLKQNIKSTLNKCKKDGSSYKKMKRAVQGGDLSALSTISGIRQNLSRFQRVKDWQKNFTYGIHNIKRNTLSLPKCSIKAFNCLLNKAISAAISGWPLWFPWPPNSMVTMSSLSTAETIDFFLLSFFPSHSPWLIAVAN